MFRPIQLLVFPGLVFIADKADNAIPRIEETEAIKKCDEAMM